MDLVSNSNVKTIAILLLLAISGYLLICILMPFLAPILWASLLAIFISPMQQYFNRKIASKNLAALVGVTVTLSVIILPTMLLFVQLVQEINQLYHHVRDGQELDRLFNWFKDGNFSNWLQQHLGISTSTLRENLSGYIEKFSGWAISYTTSIISNFFLLVIELFFITFTLFFLLRDGNIFLSWLMNLIPIANSHKEQLVKKFRDVIHATLVGNFMVAGTQGGLAGLMFYILDIPGALLWTLVMSMLSLLPLLGSFIIWLPAAIWLIVGGHVIKGIVLIVWGVLIVGLVDNFMRPLLMGRQTNLHTIAVFYALLGGLKLYGPLGLVLGPVIVVSFITLIDFLVPSPVATSNPLTDSDIETS